MCLDALRYSNVPLRVVCLPKAALPDEGPLDLELRFLPRFGRLWGALAYNKALLSQRSAGAASAPRMANDNSKEQ